jgi:hypothetical protein
MSVIQGAVFFVLAVVSANAARAGDTLFWNDDDLQAALTASQPIKRMISQGLDVAQAGDGTLLGYGPLAGKRIGPYRFQASAKATERGEEPLQFQFSLLIKTAIKFFDKSGNQTEDLRSAIGLTQAISSVEISPAPASASAEAIECEGVVWKKPAYISTAPPPPYDRCIKKSFRDWAGRASVPIVGDFYLFSGFDRKEDLNGDCLNLNGVIRKYDTLVRKDDGKTLEFTLTSSKFEEPDQALRIDRASGQAIFFYIDSRNGKWAPASQRLACKIKDERG